MKITRKSFYAIQALLYLNNNPGKIISSVEISEKQNIPKSFMQTIFCKLARKNITESLQGPTGGHKLKIKATDLTIWKVFEAIGEIGTNKKAKKENKTKAVEFGLVENYMDEFDDLIETKLLSLTLHDVSIGKFDVSSVVEKESECSTEKILEEINPILSDFEQSMNNSDPKPSDNK